MRVVYGDAAGNVVLQEFDYCAIVPDFAVCMDLKAATKCGGLFLSSSPYSDGSSESVMLSMSLNSARTAMLSLLKTGYADVTFAPIINSLDDLLRLSKRGDCK